MEGDDENPMKKADFKCEAIFIGEIIGATDYEGDGELYAEILVETSDNWELISSSERALITQASSKNVIT